MVETTEPHNPATVADEGCGYHHRSWLIIPTSKPRPEFSLVEHLHIAAPVPAPERNDHGRPLPKVSEPSLEEEPTTLPRLDPGTLGASWCQYRHARSLAKPAGGPPAEIRCPVVQDAEVPVPMNRTHFGLQDDVTKVKPPQ